MFEFPHRCSNTWRVTLKAEFKGAPTNRYHKTRNDALLNEYINAIDNVNCDLVAAAGIVVRQVFPAQFMPPSRLVKTPENM